MSETVRAAAALFCPRVTVVVPAFNAAATLPTCLRALAEQDYPHEHYEVIVVDDGSTDETAALARAAGVRVISQPNRGPAAARNAGIAAATGEIIVFTDADCAPLADWIRQMVAPLADGEIAGVKGSYRTQQRETVARLAQCEFEERYDRLARRPTIDFVDSYAAALRADVLRRAGGFDPAFPHANNEDVDLSYRLARLGYRFVFNRQAVVYHRHVASWRGYFRLKIRRGYWRIMALKMHPGKALRDSYTPQLLKLQVLLVAAAAGATLMGFVWRGGLLIAAGALVALLLSALPFLRTVWRRERAVTLWAVPFVVVRAAAFALGIVAGLIGLARFHPTISPKVLASADAVRERR
ncbi:MAG: glycosyltransferase [Anaerolineae bacterium]|nr:glycosyltransferase [Anaerolineae bacterium]